MKRLTPYAIVAFIALAGCQSYHERAMDYATSACVSYGYTPYDPEWRQCVGAEARAWKDRWEQSTSRSFETARGY